jgi:hypothetical protein
MTATDSAELFHSLKVSDAVPEILGLVWPSFRPKSGPKSKIFGRVLKQVFGALVAQPKSAWEEDEAHWRSAFSF